MHPCDLPAAMTQAGSELLARDDLLAAVRERLPERCTAQDWLAACQAARGQPGADATSDVPAVHRRVALQMLTELADTLPVGVCAVTPDFQLLIFNRAARKLLSFPDELFEGGLPTFRELLLFNARRGEYGPGDPQALADKVLDKARQMEPHQFQRTRPDGTVLDVRGAPMLGGGFCTIWTDITELDRAQAEVHEKARTLREQIDSTPGTMALIDRDGVIRLANKGLAEFYGKASVAEVEGLALSALIGAERFAEIEHWISAAQAGQPTTYRRTFTRPDGRSASLQLYLEPRFDAEGKPDGIYTVGVDITALVESECKLQAKNDKLQALNDKLEAAQSQLMQSEKLASIGQLAAGVAHEINNPVGFVASNTNSLGRYVDDLFAVIDAYEALEPKLPCDDPDFERLQEVKANADLAFLKEDARELLEQSTDGLMRVKKIVQDLKDFSHADTTHCFEEADLERCLDSTLNIAHNEVKYKANVVKEYGHPPAIECVPSQLNQVFLNMVVNAGHAIAQQGTITVRTGAEGDHAWVEIEDTGSGMDEATVQRIFEPFFTTKPVGTGTGLGLSLSYGIVSKHHGRIEVHSEVDVGTRFRIWLPLKQPQGASAA